jgi:hypothetical protein
MTCFTETGETATGDGPKCVWHEEGEANLECWVQRNPDYCAQFGNKEECQQRITTDPLQDDGCVWATETIHSTSEDSCEPAQTLEA